MRRFWLVLCDYQLKKLFPNSNFSLISADAIIENGVSETVAYIKRLNLPITGNWNEESFHVQSLFNLNPEVAFRIFFDQNMKHKPNRKKVIFGNLDLTYTHDLNTYDDAKAVLRLLNFDESLVEEALSDYVRYLQQKLPIEDERKVDPAWDEDEIFQDKNFSSQSWDGIIRSYLLNLGFNSSEQVYYLGAEGYLVLQISRIFEKLSKREIANVFTVAFILKYQKAFIVYPFTRKAEKLFGTKRSHQRFEQCLEHLETHLKQPFDALMVDKLIDVKTLTAATEFAKESYEDVRGALTVPHYSPKTFGSLRLSDESTSIMEASVAYENLKLKGSETLIEMYVEIDQFKHKKEISKPEFV